MALKQKNSYLDIYVDYTKIYESTISKSMATIKLNKALFVDKTLLLGKLFSMFIFLYK